MGNQPIRALSQKKGKSILALLDPLIGLTFSFALLAALLYKKVSIGIALFSTAITMTLLSIEPNNIPRVLFETTTDSTTMSLVLVTLGIMFLSLLYKETKVINTLSQSFSGILRNPKLIVSTLPAIIGLLPVPGGALMSAPLVEAEAGKLGLERDKRTYVNVWFRHIIFPVYPISQLLILTAALTGVALTSIMMNQIPVVITMAIIGYFAVLRKTSTAQAFIPETTLQENLKGFFITFSPILLTILAVMVFSIDVAIASFIGLALLIIISRPSSKTLTRIVSNGSAYNVALAAYSAMLLRSVMSVSGVSQTLGQTIVVWNVSEVLLLAAIPALLSFVVGSPSGGVAVSVPILAGMVAFDVSSASLLYISAYLGYLAAPIHLCLALTASYFKCPLGKLYRFLAPSVAISFVAALMVYYIL